MEEFDSLFSKIGLNLHLMKPQMILDILNSLDDVCCLPLFSNANMILGAELPKIFAASFLTLPFLSANSTLEEAVKVVKHLQLNRFFELDEPTLARCSIITAKQNMEMTNLLSDQTFLDLIGRNEYQGIRWFRGEAFQECMYLTVFARALGKKGKPTPEEESAFRKEIDKWLRRGSAAQYKVDGLFV